MVHTNRHPRCDRPPAIITKVLVLSVSTKQILSMVEAVKCPICLYMLHQLIELPCHAYAVCSSCLKEWIRVTVRLQCPCCYSVTSLQPAELIQPPELNIIWLLGDIMVHVHLVGQMLWLELTTHPIAVSTTSHDSSTSST